MTTGSLKLSVASEKWNLVTDSDAVWDSLRTRRIQS